MTNFRRLDAFFNGDCDCRQRILHIEYTRHIQYRRQDNVATNLYIEGRLTFFMLNICTTDICLLIKTIGHDTTVDAR